MKLPQKPPQQLPSTERLHALFPHYHGWGRGDNYLPWNDLRRRPAPAGFSHAEWWWALKQNRRSRLKSIPLLDRKGEQFVFGLPDQLAELLHRIDRRLGFAVGLPEAVTNPNARDQYIISSLIQEAITSSQLEGAATTREVAKEMLRSRRPPRDTNERMILNNYLTMQRIRELRDSPLTPELVLQLQARVTEGTLDNPDAIGRFRRTDETVRVIDDIEGTVFHDPPAAGELPARMEAMCAFANGETPAFFLHPVLRAIILHFWLAYDHPFVDGNGRTARALFYWAMLRQDYMLFEFISISQILLRAPVRYAMSFLHTESDDNDLTYFILHQADVIREAVEALHVYVGRKTAEIKIAERQLRGLGDLNHRQQALLAHALREPMTRYSIRGHQTSHNTSFQTARDDLFDLVERGFVTVAKKGRSYVFRVPADLASKLESLGQAMDSPPQDEDDPKLDLGPSMK